MTIDEPIDYNDDGEGNIEEVWVGTTRKTARKLNDNWSYYDSNDGDGNGNVNYNPFNGYTAAVDSYGNVTVGITYGGLTCYASGYRIAEDAQSFLDRSIDYPEDNPTHFSARLSIKATATYDGEQNPETNFDDSSIGEASFESSYSNTYAYERQQEIDNENNNN